MSKYILGLVIVLIPLIGSSTPEYPDSLSTPNVVVFGDSLSDSGYYDKLPDSYSGWPTIDGSIDSIKKQPTFTTPQKLPTTWLQQLANSNKINSAIPNNIGTPKYNILHKSVTGKLNGNIYAAGGATTVCAGIGGDYGPHSSYTPPPVGPRSNKSCPMNRYNQIDSYLKQHDGKANPKDIYIIWAGANNAFMLLADPNITDKKAVSGMQEAAKDVIEDVHLLQEKGAKKILVLALPDLKITPAMTVNGTEPNSATAILSSKMSTAFNNALDSTFSKQKDSVGKVLFLRDDFNFFNKIVYRKKITVDGVKYSFDNVNESSCDFGGPNSLTCLPKEKNGNYLFADTVHPTSYAQQALAGYIYANGIKLLVKND